MDKDIMDRFKALKSIADDCAEIDEEELEEIRALEIHYE